MRLYFAIFSAFTLLATGPVAAGETKPPSPAAAPGDKMICKRFLRTGSLVDAYKTCKTKSEWDREHENLQHLNVVDSCRDRANGGALCGPT